VRSPEVHAGAVIVIGGSSADGFGVEDEIAYVHRLGVFTGRETRSFIRHALRLSDGIALLRSARPAREDVLVLHIGVVDAGAKMPRSFRRLARLGFRGRGNLAASGLDRRTWSRFRRRLAVEVERAAVKVARAGRLERPITPIDDYRRTCCQLERELSAFTGLAICIVSERGPGVDTRLEHLTPEYTSAFRRLVVDKRQAEGLPVAALELDQILHDHDYLTDRFHPNESGHRRISEALIDLVSSVNPHRGP
jgi:hypothetical protein